MPFFINLVDAIKYPIIGRMKIKFFLILLLMSALLNAQTVTDSLSNYLEDQLYISLHYNNLMNTPNDFNNYGFSNGVSVGFIKDIPLNDQRNIGFGIGIGFANNTYKNNLKLNNNSGILDFSIQNDGFDTNKISSNALEFPVEFRWRTSTLDKFKFWRIYTGIKVSYLYKTEYTYLDSLTNYSIKNPEIINKWQYGLTLSAGYSTFNLYTYLGLKPLYKEVIINNEKTPIKELKFGLIFYIL